MPHKYETLEALKAAYDRGDLSAPLMLDNDTASVCAGEDGTMSDDAGEVFEMHPAELLEKALTLLGIPWEEL